MHMSMIHHYLWLKFQNCTPVRHCIQESHPRRKYHLRLGHLCNSLRSYSPLQDIRTRQVLLVRNRLERNQSIHEPQQPEIHSRKIEQTCCQRDRRLW